MRPRALVTGANGFLGRNTCKMLSQNGYSVIGVGHGDWADDKPIDFGIENWFEIDINLDTLRQYGGEPELIVHCAGSGAVGFSMQNPTTDFHRSVGSLSSLLEYIRVFSPNSKVIFPSSAAVYGEGVKLPISESSQLNPISVYGFHKLMAELLCKSYSMNFDLSIIVIRFFSLYGEGLKKQLLWDAGVKYSAGMNEFNGTGKEVRDWLHVEDAANLIYTASKKSSQKYTIVNGGRGVGITVSEVVEKLYEMLGGNVSPSFTGQSRIGDPSAFCADISEVNKWGWQPKIPLEDGIERYAKWFSEKRL